MLKKRSLSSARGVVQARAQEDAAILWVEHEW